MVISVTPGGCLDEDLLLIRCPLLTNNVTVPFFNDFKRKNIWKTEKFELELNFQFYYTKFNLITKFRYFCGMVLTLNSLFHYIERSL